jgi:membrane dipeptidase
LETCAALPEITAALLERGYGESDVQKILGGNFMRVVKEVLG